LHLLLLLKIAESITYPVGRIFESQKEALRGAFYVCGDGGFESITLRAMRLYLSGSNNRTKFSAELRVLSTLKDNRKISKTCCVGRSINCDTLISLYSSFSLNVNRLRQALW
jgi:hypothetical protein